MSEGPQIITLKAELVHVDRKERAVRIGDYGFLISKKKKNYTVTIVKRKGLDAEILAKIITDSLGKVENKLKEIGDQFLAENAKQIIEKLSEHLEAWHTLLLKQKALRLFFQHYMIPYIGGREYVWNQVGGIKNIIFKPI